MIPFHVQYSLDIRYKGGSHSIYCVLMAVVDGDLGALSSKEYVQASLLWWARIKLAYGVSWAWTWKWTL